jgi:hypothetical protein
MRFEVAVALVGGILLPVLETCRRGLSHWGVNFTTMFEDYVIGVLLFIAGWAAYRERSWGAPFLLLAWAYATGLMSTSFWFQLEETLRETIVEPNNSIVVVVKFLMWITCLVCLVLAFRRVTRVATR